MSSLWSSLLTLLNLLLLLLLQKIDAGHQLPPENEPMNMDHMEKETLFVVMEAVSSDREWRLSKLNPCRSGSSWPGLECKAGPDNHLHVSRLDFGISPNPTCKRSAQFPGQVFTLPYLQSIFFYTCFTHTKTLFSIPPSSNNTTSSLQQLSLRSNPALFGPIPPQISSLKSLQVLTLSQNNLHGTIPPEITRLTSLVHLDLSYNYLTGTIPHHMGSLKNLVGFDLSYNSITGPIPESIGQMGMLQKLDLSSNLLTGPIPNSTGNLHSLSFLALSNNRLMGYSPAAIEKLGSLQYFIVENNGMSMQLPKELGKLVKLQELRLASCGYFGVIPLSFSNLENLTSLSLQNNRLTGEIPASLSSLSHIYHLNLSGNLLSGVIPFNATFVRRLGRNLDLSGNSGLCLNESRGFDSGKIGIGLCRFNATSNPLIHPQKRSCEGAFGPCISIKLQALALLLLLVQQLQ